MKSKTAIRAAAIALAAILPTAAFARTDQIWLNAGLDYNVYGDFSLHIDQELEYDNSKLLDEETTMLAVYRFCPFFGAAFGHRIVRERAAGSGPLLTEHRPTLDLNFFAPEFWTLLFDFRSRFEYRDKSSAQPHMRYRERFRLRTSWSATQFGLSPFASEELLFSDIPGGSDSDLFCAMRSQVGLAFNPVPGNKNLECAMYFMVHHDVEDGAQDWAPLNVFGFDVSYSF